MKRSHSYVNARTSPRVKGKADSLKNDAATTPKSGKEVANFSLNDTRSSGRINVDSEEIIHGVNNIVPKYYDDISLRLCVRFGGNIMRSHQENCVSQMQNELSVLSAMNLEQWTEAFCIALSEITSATYIHYLVTQKLINYILNVNQDCNIGICIDALNKLLIMHPPYRTDMKVYYRKIIENKFVQLTKTGQEPHNLFWCVIEQLKTLSMQDAVIANTEDAESTWQTAVNFDRSIDKQVKELTEWLSSDGYQCPTGSIFKKQAHSVRNEFYELLPQKVKLERCCLVLEFIVNILECDFVNWYNNHSRLNRDRLKNSDGPLLVKILWENVLEIGVLNHNIRQLIILCRSMRESCHVQLVHRLITLTAELVMISDVSAGPSYLIFKQNCINFAREYAVCFLEDIHSKPDDVEQFLQIKPSWFRLLVCTTIIENITGNPCTPELQIVTDIMEHIWYTHKNKSTAEIEEEGSQLLEIDQKLIEKLKKLKSVNSRLRTGYGDTRLHTSCRQGKSADIQALLTFPELDINLTNNMGRTPLHEAANNGRRDCVRLLLQFTPCSHLQRRCDTRIKDQDGLTPLHCAVTADHVDVCELLLEHTGSVLLEDITDSNETALELSRSQQMFDLLNKYKTNTLITQNSYKKMYFTSDKTQLVINLCTILTRSYLAAHRTWDVYHFMKQNVINKSNKTNINAYKCQYTKYHKDFKTNLPKLRNVLSKFLSSKLLKQELQPLMCVISLNKSKK